MNAESSSPVVMMPTAPSKRIWRWLGWLVLALALGGAAAGGFLAYRYYFDHTFNGGIVSPIEQAPDITLIDQTGQPFNLSDAKGKWILLDYGYTTCPDVCPATLAILGRVQDLLEEDADRIQVVFVTVDPERDTPDKMGEYVNHFGDGTIALTGSTEAIAAAAQPYGVRYARVEMPESALVYAMNHTAFVYLINPDFEWVMVYPFGITAQDLTDDLQFLMSQE